MISVVILGNGNVATHLYSAFSKALNINVTQINSRKLSTIPSSDVTIIAVSDDAIRQVSQEIGDRKGLIMHTSGAVDINAIAGKRKGVFYPLQSFTKNAIINFNEIPFCLETSHKDDFNLLENVAKSIGKKIYQIDSEQRKKLHVAAVFVNNFSNHMYTIANDICEKNDVPFEILYPLIEETAKKAQSISPKDAQTGPAKRNDVQTIQNHLEQLNLQQQKIYQLLTKSIQNSIE
ncbi:hypothetical protein KCTC32516_01850 [Polaribacter huanghezhanensis]|uniref:Rossmann-like and DUF2520 domain-containing protein n=1 Tax=Polaribacter huanghezhanensis TaxID=1354726 RepID=UPI0026486F4C|nr:DUF2520 domain-containing protein [Polaribacter huanghezhanensis]WKD86475.1 hypothetical protein KCTC32516_01850 [Polaribacter huanghezhanensis]